MLSPHKVNMGPRFRGDDDQDHWVIMRLRLRGDDD
jgi:hypothetical protein